MNIILDVDTGYDDALAILLATRTPSVNVLGITCVAGNHYLDQIVTNTLKILDVAGAPAIPVAAGCLTPLMEVVRLPDRLHGGDGMADLGLPISPRSTVPFHAVELLRRLLTDASQPVTIVALAPMTNLAVFLRMYPHLRHKIERIVIMGGAHITFGNTSPTAEFNIRCDPDAAHIVLSSGLPITLYPLDPFRQVAVPQDEAETMTNSASWPTQIAGRICASVMKVFKRDHAFIGDAGAVAVAIDPTRANIQRFPITVELSGSPATRGMTVIDRRNAYQRASLTEWWHTSAYEVDVVTEVNANYYKAIFLAAL